MSKTEWEKQLEPGATIMISDTDSESEAKTNSSVRFLVYDGFFLTDKAGQSCGHQLMTNAGYAEFLDQPASGIKQGLNAYATGSVTSIRHIIGSYGNSVYTHEMTP